MEVKTKWKIDKPHSEIGFSISHMTITNVKGVFKEYGASIYTIEEDFSTAEIDFWLDPNSIDTRDTTRDSLLRREDFFDVVHHKEITFRSNAVHPTGQDGKFELWGDLVIRGISHKIKLEVESEGMAIDTDGSRKAGFLITGNVNRKSWQLNWNKPLSNGGVLIGETVTLNCEIEVIKSKEVMEQYS